MRYRQTLLALLLYGLCGGAVAEAGQIYNAEMACNINDVTLTTTSEAGVVVVGPISVRNATARVRVRGWAQVTLGTGTTSVTPRLKRGASGSGTLIGEAHAVLGGRADGDTMVVVVEAVDEIQDYAAVGYQFTVQQAGASGNGTVVQSCISMDVID